MDHGAPPWKAPPSRSAFSRFSRCRLRRDADRSLATACRAMKAYSRSRRICTTIRKASPATKANSQGGTFNCEKQFRQFQDEGTFLPVRHRHARIRHAAPPLIFNLELAFLFLAMILFFAPPRSWTADDFLSLTTVLPRAAHRVFPVPVPRGTAYCLSVPRSRPSL